MWGNSLGWFLSIVWAVTVITGLAVADHVLDATSSRTAFSADSTHAAVLSFTVAPETVIPVNPAVPPAGPIYRRAIEEYARNNYVYDTFARTGSLVEIDGVPAIKILSEAIGSADTRIFADHPEQIINYDSDHAALTPLLTLGQCAIRAALLQSKDYPDLAMKNAQAAFALGAALTTERIAFAELDAGLTLLAGSAKTIHSLEAIANHSDRAEAAQQFDAARQALYTERIQPTQRVIGTIDDQVLALHAGDVIYFAKSADEKMWRVEAILKLGRYRFNASRIGDQRTAERLLKKLENDSDPIIALAAKTARQLTIERYRMIH